MSGTLNSQLGIELEPGRAELQGLPAHQLSEALGVVRIVEPAPAVLIVLPTGVAPATEMG